MDTAEREAKLREALKGCLYMMECQEKRETEEFHWAAHSFQPVWNVAKDKARAALAKGGE